MKKEASQKKTKWLWPVLGLVLLVAVVGIVLALVLPGLNAGSKDTTDGRPDLYWNLDRAVYVDATLNTSTREKAEDGFFHIRFAYDGGPLELLVQDKQLVNYIDSMDVMGLVFDGDGYVVDALPVKDIAVEVESGAFIQTTEAGKFCTNSSIAMNGMKKEFEVTDQMVIYDVTAGAEIPGQEISVEQLQIMDKVAIYANQQEQITHVYVMSHVRASKVYWRANQYTSGGKTTRVPDENGVYTIPFFCEGERVELKCKNVTEVNYIDKQSRYSAHFGLVFDEEGYIEEAIHSYEAIRGIIRSERFDVTAIDGNKISTTKIIGSNAGTTDEFTISDDCVIYDVSPAAQAEDRQGKPVDSLQIGDRIVCFADAEGEPLFIYVAERIVEDAIWCYNIERKYDSTLKETKRVPDADGWYVFEIFSEGKILKVKTKDKAVATEIDAIGAKVMGLTLDGDVIKEVYTVYSVFGYGHAGQGRYITGITGSIYTCIRASAPDKSTTGIMAADCKVYNLSDVGTYGEETKLQYGDFIYAYQNPNLEILQIFVMKRMVDYPVYYGVQRMYNSTTKETTRVPDAEGWYVFEVSRDGKLYTVKTKSKAMATKMDAINPAAMALSVGKDGVVYDVYAAQYATGGNRRAHGYTVTKIDGNTVETQYKNADGTIATRVLTLAEDCKTFNVTTLYTNVFGEYTTVRVGDVITAYTDIFEETKLLYVRSRKTDKLYWNSLRLYDDDEKVSLREPDADGWYVYTLASNGKVETLKTKDKAIADKVDYYGGAFTLNVKDGVILSVGSPSYAKNTNGTSLLNYDVVKIDGRKVTLQYHQEGSSKDGEIQTITLSSNAKIYEVGPDAGSFGAETKLQVGDRVRAYKSDKDDTYTYVFIRFRDSRDKGVDGYCDVCDKEVYWVPWVGGSFSTSGGHFYLPADITTTYLPCSTGRKTLPECTVCLDLNGHTYYRTNGRAMYVYENATLNIMDTAGGGTVTSSGIKDSKSGGVLGIPGGTVNLYSGTLKLADDHLPQERAGVVLVGVGSSDEATPGVFNMYGGTITGGEVTDRGGNVAVSGGVFNLYGGLVENGKAEKRGGNIVTMSNGVLVIAGGTVSGGVSASGGNIYAGTGAFVMYDGTVSGGSGKDGGNIYSLETCVIVGGAISGGTATGSGGNVYASDYTENSVFGFAEAVMTGGSAGENGGNIYSEAPMLIAGGTIEKGTTPGSGGNIYIDGCTLKIEDGTISNGTSTARGGNIYIASKGVVSMSGGTVTGGTSGTGNANGGGNICLIGGSTLNMTGGSVTNGVSANTAGNILAGTGYLNISGGEISGGHAEGFAQNIYVYYDASNAEITGGNIESLTYTNAVSFRLSGSPKIDRLEIASGKKVELGELTGEAKVCVEADGVFTNVLENPGSYQNYFTPGLEGWSVYEEDSALAMAAGVKEDMCAHCGKTVIWKLWSGKATNGHYYLNEKVALSAEVSIPAGNELVIDLAGNTIEASGRAFYAKGDLAVLDTGNGGQIVGSESGTKTSTNGGVIRVSGGTFELYSGTLRYAGTGTYQGGVLYLEKTATANLIGGTVTDGISNDRGGNISVAGTSTLNVSGTTVQNGTANSGNSNGGGNIFIVGSSVVNITGGKVIGGNTTKTGGNILVGTGTLNVSGGEISGGHAEGFAQNIYVYYDASNAEITGGTIESLYYEKAASFKLSGNPVIGVLDIAEGMIVELGQMTDGADVTVSATGVFTTANENAESYVNDEIKLADTSKVLRVVENQLEVYTVPVGAKLAACAHCDGSEVLWYQFTDASTGGHYYLAGEYTQSEEYGIVIAEGDTVVLDLAGNDIVGDKVRAFDVYGDLFIMDSVGNGEIVTGGSDDTDTYGGVARVRKGSLTLLSGTLRLADDHSTSIKRGGVIYVDGGASVTVKGGAVMNGVTTERGGNIYLAGTGAKLTVEGGLITNGTCGSINANGGGNIAVLTGSTVEIKGGTVSNGNSPKTAGNILATGNLIISGGSVTGGKADGVAQNIYVLNDSGDVTVSGGSIESLTAKQPKSLTVSGKPVIGSLELLNGQKVTLGELEQNTEIYVIAEGVFTEVNANAESYVTAGYIKAFDRHQITAENDQLSMSYVTTGYCEHCEQDNVTWTAWDGTSLNGHFYMTGDVTATETVTVTADDVLVLDLNGFTYSNTSSRAFVVKGEMAVLDSVGTGVITAAGATGNGGVIRNQGSTFDLYNGTLRLAATHNAVSSGGVLSAEAGATVNLRGGLITDGETTARGGNIYISGSTVEISGTTVTNGTSGTGNANGGGNICSVSNGTLKITGGAVTNGVSANTAGNILAGSGTLIISGGEISGGTAANAGADIYVYGGNNTTVSGGSMTSLTNAGAGSLNISGAPKIDLLEVLADGSNVLYPATFGKLDAGAKIFVKPAVSGKVSEANSDLQAYLTAEYILPASGNITLTVDNNVLNATVA